VSNYGKTIQKILKVLRLGRKFRANSTAVAKFCDDGLGLGQPGYQPDAANPPENDDRPNLAEELIIPTCT
jgi:hypothetical protein